MESILQDQYLSVFPKPDKQNRVGDILKYGHTNCNYDKVDILTDHKLIIDIINKETHRVKDKQ